MSPDLNALAQPFAEEELKTFTGRAGREFTYIEDETVMDRLDAAFGMGNWAIHTDPVPVYEGVVKVRLGVRPTDASEWVWYEDYGYPSNAGGEALKEAVSDGIRRCGRYLGIARDLYRKDSPPVTRTAPAPRAARPTAPTPIRPTAVPAAASGRSSTDLPDGPDLDWTALEGKPAAPAPTVLADGVMTTKELMDRAEALKVPVKVLGETSKRLYGQQAWKLTDLTATQRYAVAVEVGLV